MYVGRDFDPSDEPEREPFCFDFVKDLPEGDTITSATWTCSVAARSEKPDAEAATRLDGDPIWQGTKTFQKVSGLLPGVIYRLQAVVHTNNDNDISLWSYVEGLAQEAP